MKPAREWAREFGNRLVTETSDLGNTKVEIRGCEDLIRQIRLETLLWIQEHHHDDLFDDMLGYTIEQLEEEK